MNRASVSDFKQAFALRIDEVSGERRPLADPRDEARRGFTFGPISGMHSIVMIGGFQ